MNKNIVLLFLLTFVSASAVAQDRLAGIPGWYIGVGIGQAEASDIVTGDEIGNDILYGLGTSGFIGTMDTSDDDSDTAWKIMAGYQINRIVGLEAFYGNLGEISAEAVGFGYTYIDGQTFVGEIDTKLSNEAKVFGFAVNVGHPISRSFRLYGKAGVFHYSTDTAINVGVRGQVNGFPVSSSVRETDSEDGYSALAGAGLSYSFNRNLQLVAEWEAYLDIESVTGESDVHLLSAALQYRF